MSGLFSKKTTDLYRLPIAFFTAYSAFTGHLLGPAPSFPAGMLTALAVFILAAGASALNQYQERDIDARMERTRRRPLPAGLLSPLQVLLVALLLVAAGLALLAAFDGWPPFLLGILSLAWYNGLYTALKRVTAFAAVPGAVVGMIPPAIGWSAAGGALNAPPLFALCFLLFMWQVPHFWLQMLDHGEEYGQAGLPSLTRSLSEAQVARITFAWICSAAASGLLLPLYGTIQSPLLYALLLPGAIVLVVSGTRMMRHSTHVLASFRLINQYLLFVMALVTVESLFLR